MIQDLRTGEIPPCPRCITEDSEPITICSTCPLPPYLMKEYPGGGGNQQEQYFGTDCAVQEMLLSAPWED